MNHSEWGGSFWWVGRSHPLGVIPSCCCALDRLWFVRCQSAIRGPFLGYSGSLYAEAGDTTGETQHDLGYGRKAGSCRQVPGLAAKTEEDEWRRTGKRMIDLTLNEAF